MKCLSIEASLVIVTLLVYSEVQKLHAEQCTISAPQFNDDNMRSSLPLKSQAIVPTYKFLCCGTVTNWRAFLQPGGRHHTNVYHIRFQVWRPSVQQEYRYYLVGETVANPAMLDRSGEANEPSNLTVQHGDVVGYYVRYQDNENGGIQLETTNHGNNMVWSLLQPEEGILHELQIGPGSTLSPMMAAPILRINVLVSPCPLPATPSVSENLGLTNLPVTTRTSTNIPLTTRISTNLPVTTRPSTNLPVTTRTTINLPVTTRTSISNIPMIKVTSEDLKEANNQQTGSNATSVDLKEENTNSQPTGSNTTSIVVGVLITLVIASFMIGAVIILAAWLMKRKKHDCNRNEIYNPNYSIPTPNSSVTKSRSSTENNYDYIPFSVPTHQSANLDISNNPLQCYEISSPSDKYSVLFEQIPASADSKTHELGPEYSHLHYKHSALKVQETDKQSEAEERVVYESPGFVVPNRRERKENLCDSVRKYNKLEFFEKEQTYWVPASSSATLYDQLASKKYREIPKKEIIIMEQLGSGQFGKVSKALWNVSSGSLLIAVKQLRSNASDAERIKLLQEAAIMGQFWHTNVVKLYGLVTIGNPVSICLEYMKNGDLKSYLANFEIKRDEPPNGLKDIRFYLVQAAKNIASGMNYLSSKAFVHRDLAARNIFLNESYVCKIGDFGMSRELMDHIYYTSTSNAKIPIRWTAPEALLYRKYSPASDVWSYGIVLYEIWSLGKRPYSNFRNHEVVNLVKKGFCQPPPPGCPRAMYRLMVDCWNPSHQQRPRFEEILTYLYQPTGELLHWSTDLNHLSAGVADLGSPVRNTEKLHSDLQEKYKKETNEVT